MKTKRKIEDGFYKLLDIKFTNDLIADMDMSWFVDFERSEKNIPDKYLKTKKETIEKKVKEINQNARNAIIRSFIFHLIILGLTTSLYIIAFCLKAPVTWVFNVVVYSIICGMLSYDFGNLCYTKYHHPFYEPKTLFWAFIISIVLMLHLLIFSMILQFYSGDVAYFVLSIISAVITFIMPLIWSEIQQKTNGYLVLKIEIDFLSFQILSLLETTRKAKNSLRLLSTLIEIKNEYIKKRLKLLKYYTKITYFKNTVQDEINLLKKEKDKMIDSNELLAAFVNRSNTFRQTINKKDLQTILKVSKNNRKTSPVAGS